jgi:hypothetical protein
MVKLYNLLFERATDSVVQGFIKYFKNHILPNLSDPEYTNGGYFLLYPKGKVDFKYETYKETTGDNGEIIRNSSDLEDMLGQFEILVYPKTKRSDASGDMDSSGKMRVFLPTWDYESKPTEEQKQSLLEDIKKYFASKYFLNDLLPHELGHYINALRSANKNKGKPIDFRAKTRKRNSALQFEPGTDEYRDSTEEIQARLTAFEDYIIYILDKEYQDLNFDEKALLSSIGTNDYKEFIKRAFSSDQFSSLKNQQDKIPPKVYQRVVNRLLDIFNRYKNTEKVKIFTPPPLP